MVDCYLDLKGKTLNKLKVGAMKRAKEDFGKDYDGELEFPDLKLDINEIYLDKEKGELSCSGYLRESEETLGFISLDIPFEKFQSEAIEYLVEKLKRMKTLIQSLN